MALAWSHTDEAYANVQRHIRQLPNEAVAEIVAEWDVEAAGKGWCDQLYNKALAEARDHIESGRRDVLTDFIWGRASDLSICENAYMDAWVCPKGCHTVSFSREGEE